VKPVPSSVVPAPPRKPDSSEIIELPRKKPAAAPQKRPAQSPPAKPRSNDPGEEEFWKLTDQ
jgi:hypothetical protein